MERRRESFTLQATYSLRDDLDTQVEMEVANCPYEDRYAVAHELSVLMDQAWDGVEALDWLTCFGQEEGFELEELLLFDSAGNIVYSRPIIESEVVAYGVDFATLEESMLAHSTQLSSHGYLTSTPYRGQNVIEAYLSAPPRNPKPGPPRFMITDDEGQWSEPMKVLYVSRTGGPASPYKYRTLVRVLGGPYLGEILGFTTEAEAFVRGYLNKDIFEGVVFRARRSGGSGSRPTIVDIIIRDES